MNVFLDAAGAGNPDPDPKDVSFVHRNSDFVNMYKSGSFYSKKNDSHSYKRGRGQGAQSGPLFRWEKEASFSKIRTKPRILTAEHGFGYNQVGNFPFNMGKSVPSPGRNQNFQGRGGGPRNIRGKGCFAQETGRGHHVIHPPPADVLVHHSSEILPCQLCEEISNELRRTDLFAPITVDCPPAVEVPTDTINSVNREPDITYN